MCGIAGILNLGGGRPISASVLKRMGDSMVHRGPDGAGQWVSDDSKIGFAHRRLAIVDLSDAAAQPMSNGDRSVWVTFNGEIYNHVALRRSLEQTGHRFRTDHSDTEVLVHGFTEWGIDGLLERIEGMFALGLWDDREKHLYLARDRIGIKPIYFTRTATDFVFASEIKAILTDPTIPRAIEPAAVNHYLSFMVAPAPLTMFKNVFKLPAGHVMKIDKAGRMQSRRFWDALPGNGIKPNETKGMSEAELEEFYSTGIRRRLESSIDKRMMSDVPFGVFLSGGIDSSANVALMSRLMDRPVDTFTVGFKDHRQLNELEYARKVSSEFKTNHCEILINEQDMVSYLDDLVYQQDEPIADWVCVPLYFVSKLAKDSGVTVVQVGEGSDEQFSGYNSYAAYMRLHRYFWRPYQALTPKVFRQALATTARALLPTSRRTDWIIDIMSRAGRDQELFWGGAHAFWNVHKERLVRPGVFDDLSKWPDLDEAGFSETGLDAADSGSVIEAFTRRFDDNSPGSDFLARMAYCELKLRLPELLLMRVDKITMSTSVEGRVPFLDHDLVEFTMDIPQTWKVCRGVSKYILKRALSDILPDEIIHRPKMGFGAPMAYWLRGDFGKRAEAVVLGSSLFEEGYLERKHVALRFQEHREGRRDHALHLWILFNLAAWHDHWIG